MVCVIANNYILSIKHMSLEGIIRWFIFMQLKTIVTCTFLYTFQTHIYRVSRIADRVNKSVNFEQRMISIFIIHSWKIHLFHSQSQYSFRRMISHWFIVLWFNIRKVHLYIVSVVRFMSRVHLTILHFSLRFVPEAYNYWYGWYCRDGYFSR